MSDQDIGRTTPTLRIQRCAIINLEDANIAMVSEDNIAFCVHRSVIRRLSVVFANMLEVCASKASNISQSSNYNDGVETFESLPIVRISDPSNVALDFFRLVYDQKPDLSLIMPNHQRLADLLIFCHKYMIDTILERIILLLRPFLPNELSEWRAPSHVDLPSEGVVPILLAISKANIRIILPYCLYLVVSRFRPKLHLHKFPQPLLLQYYRGFSSFLVYHFDFYENILRPLFTPSMECRRTKCRSQWDEFKAYACGYFQIRDWAVDPDPLLLLKRFHEKARNTTTGNLGDAVATAASGYCTECYNAIEVLFDTALNQLWNSLPRIFDIADNWEEIREEYRHTFALVSM